jgi:hypothetical protein
MSDIQNTRHAVLVELAERQARLGRTAVMKLCYFLQTLRSVPLGYRFTLYSYGPFDSSVLSDLSTAEVLGGLKSETVLYPVGYGYEISPGANSQSVKALAADFIEKHTWDLNWVVEQFGKFGSADLELMSTIVYVDRETAQANATQSAEELAGKVHEVKPHFKTPYILEKVATLQGLKLLKSLTALQASG